MTFHTKYTSTPIRNYLAWHFSVSTREVGAETPMMLTHILPSTAMYLCDGTDNKGPVHCTSLQDPVNVLNDSLGKATPPVHYTHTHPVIRLTIANKLLIQTQSFTQLWTLDILFMPFTSSIFAAL